MKIINILKSKWFTIILALILILLIYYYASVGWLQSKVNDEINAIKKADGAYSLESVVPKHGNTIKKEDNAAPIYEAAGKLAMYDVPYRTGKRPEEKPYLKDYRFFLKNKDKMVANLDKNKTVFQLIQEGNSKPQCRYKLHYKRGFKMIIPNLLNYRRISQLTANKGFNEISDKQYKNAAQTSTEGIKLVRRFYQGVSYKGGRNTLIMLMISIACYRNVIKPLEVMAEKNIKTDYTDAIEQLEKSLLANKNALYKSFEMERILGIHFINQVLNEKLRNRSYLVDIGMEKEFSKLSSEIGFWNAIKYRMGLKSTILRDKLYFLRYYKEALEAIKEGNTKEYDNLNKKLKEDQKRHYISWVLIPNAKKANEQFSKSMHRMKQLRDRLKELNTGNEEGKFDSR